MTQIFYVLFRRHANTDTHQKLPPMSIFKKIFSPYAAGKTTSIKAMCEELGVTDVINSPTFAIVNEYMDGKGESIYHFDFYRIKRVEEVYDIGFDEYIYSGNLCLMEWPELIEQLLPEETSMERSSWSATTVISSMG